MEFSERFTGCILAGALGDAWGAAYENQAKEREDVIYLFGKPRPPKVFWQITDDTQLTLATAEALIENPSMEPTYLAKRFLNLYRQRKLRGLGASTLKALQELDFGGHWSLVGKSGEYAAGNGAAMRIAPLAFVRKIDRAKVREVTSITHRNDEAFVGAWAIVLAIRMVLDGQWKGEGSLCALLVPHLPDTRLRDRLIHISEMDELAAIASFGSDGYVVNSVPLAIAAAEKMPQLGMEAVWTELIKLGGDTDTICSMAGQLGGTLLGPQAIPSHLLEKLKNLPEYPEIRSISEEFVNTFQDQKPS